LFADRPQIGAPRLSAYQALVRTPQGRSGVEQAVAERGVAGAELIDRPGHSARLLERSNPFRGLSAPLGAQELG